MTRLRISPALLIVLLALLATQCEAREWTPTPALDPDCPGPNYGSLRCFPDPKSLTQHSAQAVTDSLLDTRTGLGRDTVYFLSYQFLVIGLLYVMPEGFSGWTEEQKDEARLSIWWDHVRHPEWDEDDFVLNYILHPYWGATYYVRARERGYGDAAGFWYSFLLSSMYEFGAEALFEPVSIQDVIVTPLAGGFVGRYFMRIRTNIEDRAMSGKPRAGDRWLSVVTDPLGTANRFTDRLLGRQSVVRVAPLTRIRNNKTFDRDGPQRQLVVGLSIMVQW